jgi:DeoR/GlpR family transcriptional regulator of sugar metabolism
VTLAEGDFDGEVVSLGGQLRRTNQAFSGSAAESVVRGVYADVAFLGADCVHHERGISSRTLEQSTLKGLLALHARHTVVLADSSKIGRDWGSYWSALDSPYSLVTDSHAPREALEPFLAREQVDVHVSEVDGPLG